MTTSWQRSRSLFTVSLIAGLIVAACGGLESRDIRRGSAEGGSSSSAGSNNPTQNTGGSDIGGAGGDDPVGAAAGAPSQGGAGADTGAGGEGGCADEASCGETGTPLLVIEERTLSFDTLPTGVESAPSTIHVSNDGDASTGKLALQVDGAQAAAFTVSNDTCTGFALAAGASCTLNVVFKPSAVGANAAALHISATPGGADEVALTGTGTTPSSVVFDPTSKVFSLTPVNGRSAAQDFTVTNRGGTSAGAVTAITLSNSTDFKLATGSCMGATLGASGTCLLSVTFEPKSLGQKSSTLELTTANAPKAIVNLSGLAGNPAALSAPASVAFGDVPNGGNTDKIVSIGNSGDVATSNKLTATANGDYSVIANTCSSPIAPGANVCTVTVRVTPSAAGSRTGTLTLNAGDASTTVALSATSKGPASVQITMTQPAKGAVGTDYSKNFVMTVRNTGELPTGALSVSGTGNGHFSIINSSCTGVTLQPAQANSCAFTVQFTPDGPTGLVSYTATVNASPGGPKSVTVSETGTAACTTVGSHASPCTTAEFCTTFHGCSPRGVNASTYCDSGKDYECMYGCDDNDFECCSAASPCCPPQSGPQTPNVACP